MTETLIEALIEARGIDYSVGGLVILQDASAKISAGEIVTLIGPNGAGKTTLARVMLGLVRPDKGTITRRPGLKVGYMPQKLHLDPSLPLTVDGFLRLGIPRSGRGRGRRQEMRAALLAEVGAESVKDSQITDISGGELQRVMLARALLRDPDVLVLDEPVKGVDISGQAELYHLIGRIREQRGCGILMVSHDLHVVMAATDRVVCLNRHVCCAGHPSAVSRHPEFRSLFGPKIAEELALYHHDHDHNHDHGHDHGHGDRHNG